MSNPITIISDGDLDPDELAEYLAYLDAVEDGEAEMFEADEAPFVASEEGEDD